MEKTKRELRKVPLPWEHPVRENFYGQKELRPLFGHSFQRQCEQCGHEYLKNKQVVSPKTWPSDHLPDISDGEPIGYQMYETETAGTPISPVFDSVEHLVEWLVSGAVAYLANFPGTKEEWHEVAVGSNEKLDR